MIIIIKMVEQEDRQRLLWNNFPQLFKIFERPCHEANTVLIKPKSFVADWESQLNRLDEFTADVDSDGEALLDVGDLDVQSVDQAVAEYINTGLGELNRKQESSDQIMEQSQTVVSSIVDALEVRPETELREALKGEPQTIAEQAYLPLETSKVTDCSERKKQVSHQKGKIFGITPESNLQINLQNAAADNDYAKREQTLPRAVVHITVFSQVTNKRISDFSFLADSCSVASLFEAVSSTCQGRGIKPICLPAFVYVNEVFYPIDSNLALVPEDAKDGARQADSILLDDLEFKIGYPYLVRHATCNQNQQPV